MYNQLFLLTLSKLSSDIHVNIPVVPPITKSDMQLGPVSDWLPAMFVKCCLKHEHCPLTAYRRGTQWSHPMTLRPVRIASKISTKPCSAGLLMIYWCRILPNRTHLQMQDCGFKVFYTMYTYHTMLAIMLMCTLYMLAVNMVVDWIHRTDTIDISTNHDLVYSVYHNA